MSDERYDGSRLVDVATGQTKFRVRGARVVSGSGQTEYRIRDDGRVVDANSGQLASASATMVVSSTRRPETSSSVSGTEHK